MLYNSIAERFCDIHKCTGMKVGCSKMSNCDTRFQFFVSSLEKLKDGVSKFNEENDLLRDGLIQRFETAFEMAWKNLNLCIIDEGVIGHKSPKSVVCESFSLGILHDEVWYSMLKDRNAIGDIYDEQLAQKICDNIVKKYVYALEDVRELFQARMLS
ncbi:nucleotidyltransferase substrate binding protein like protein [Oxobacter pfennigii]|uniref:Nucleotidyltransferase substrate binding protein like protein n=2 Tax=Oxobacter pfennigii TaxID=36849 RepID=A0A0P8WK20_9CLOT|nr:nucleotidyltransferase substrate binding protein like protein [Oxobacter pfennigii]